MIVPSLFMALALVAQPSEAGAGEAERTAQVKRWVRSLGDEELATREGAERSLIELGPAALDLLPADTEALAAEQKSRLERVRKALEKQASEAATRASRVTLSGAYTVAEACAAIEKQTGNKLAAPAAALTALNLKLENVPFWEAADRLLDDADLVVNPLGESGVISLMPRSQRQAARSGKAAYAGIFRFEAVRATALRDLRMEPLRGLKLTLEVAWEPRLQPISLDQPLAQVKAVDENGDSLTFDEAQTTLNISPYGSRASAELELPLALPDREVRTIATLAGTLTALIPGRLETFRFPRPAEAKNAEQRKGGVTVVLREMRKNQELYEARVLVRFDEAANALESHRGWIDRNEAALVSAKGERVAPAAFEAGRRSENEQTMSFLFDVADDIGQYTLEYTTPAGLIKMPVAYELRNIPLP